VRVSARAATTALALLACAALVPDAARGALPPSYGGTLTLAAPSPVTTLDPAKTRGVFEAALARSVADPLYVAHDGRFIPRLADGPPEVEGRRVRIRIRTDIRRHGRRTIDAGFVARALDRARNTALGGWLLVAFEPGADGRIARAIADDVIELELAREGLDPAAILASSRLAIVGGPDRDLRPVGTGPFRARLSPDGSVRLTEYRLAARGAPYLARVDIGAPRSRDAALRAFELGELDVSFFGASLYGGRPRRAIRRTFGSRSMVLLLANRVSGPLRDDGLWGVVGRTIDRGRLARAGIAGATDRLRSDLPAPPLPAASRPAAGPPTLRLLVLEGDHQEERLAEVLSALLDEAGVPVRIIEAPSSRYRSLVGGRAWDLRLGAALPAIGRRGGLVGAALAEAGQIDLAKDLVLSGGLFRPEVAGRYMNRFSGLVLGTRVESVYYSAELSGLGIADGYAMSFEDIARPRGEP